GPGLTRWSGPHTLATHGAGALRVQAARPHETRHKRRQMRGLGFIREILDTRPCPAAALAASLAAEPPLRLLKPKMPEHLASGVTCRARLVVAPRALDPLRGCTI